MFGRVWEVDSSARYGDSRLRQQFGDMTRVLSQADCVVHSVDVSGLGGDDSVQRMAAVHGLAAQHHRPRLAPSDGDGDRRPAVQGRQRPVGAAARSGRHDQPLLHPRLPARGPRGPRPVPQAQGEGAAQARAGLAPNRLLRARAAPGADRAAAQVRGGPARDDRRRHERPVVQRALPALPGAGGKAGAGPGGPGAARPAALERERARGARGVRLRGGPGRQRAGPPGAVRAGEARAGGSRQRCAGVVLLRDAAGPARPVHREADGPGARDRSRRRAVPRRARAPVRPARGVPAAARGDGRPGPLAGPGHGQEARGGRGSSRSRWTAARSCRARRSA